MDPGDLKLVYVMDVDLIKSAVPGICVVTAILGPFVARLREYRRARRDQCRTQDSGHNSQSEILHGILLLEVQRLPASAAVCFCGNSLRQFHHLRWVSGQIRRPLTQWLRLRELDSPDMALST